MSTSPEMSIGESAASFSVGENKTVMDLVASLQQGGDKYSSVIFEPMLDLLPDAEEDTSQELIDAVREMMSSRKKRYEALSNIQKEIDDDQVAFIKRFESKGSVDEIAELVVFVRQAHFVRTGESSFMGGSVPKKEETLVIDTQNKLVEVVEVMAEIRDAMASGDQIVMEKLVDKMTSGNKQLMQIMTQEMKVNQAQQSTGGEGRGLALNDPALDLQMFGVAVKRVFDQLAALDRNAYSWEERSDIVRQTAVWFVSNDLLRRYLPNLFSEAGGSFELPSAVSSMIEGWFKATKSYEDLMLTKNGNLQELGGIGAEMPTGIEVESLMSSMEVKVKFLLESGKEVEVKFGLADMMDFYMGNFGSPEKLADMDVEYVMQTLRKYDDLLKDRYGDDFDAERVFGKYKRIQDFRRDLPFVRPEVENDVAIERRWLEQFAEPKVLEKAIGDFERFLSEVVSEEPTSKSNLLKLLSEVGERAKAEPEDKTLEELVKNISEIVGKIDDGDSVDIALELNEMGEDRHEFATSIEKQELIGKILSKKIDALRKREVGQLTEEEQEYIAEILNKEIQIKRGEELTEEDQKLIAEVLSKEARIRRGEELTEVEQKFIAEILNQDIYTSEAHRYKLKSGGVAGEALVGDPILLHFLDESEEQKINDDISAVPMYSDRENPLKGPLLPAWELYSRHLSDTDDNGADAFIDFVLEKAKIDRTEVMAIDLPRRNDGEVRNMEVVVGGRNGYVNRFEVGLLSNGGVAHRGEKNFAYMYEALEGKQGHIRDMEGNVLLAPVEDSDGNPMYEPKRSKGGVVEIENGEVQYQHRRNEDGKPILDENGNPVLRPKLNEKGEEMYKLSLDENGEKIIVTPIKFMTQNVLSARLGPIKKAAFSLLNLLSTVDGDPVNAGQFLPKGILKSMNWRVYAWYYNIVHPYTQDMFAGTMDDLPHRKMSGHAMVAGGKEGIAKKKKVVRALNPLRTGDDQDFTLEPYHLDDTESSGDTSLRKTINRKLRAARRVAEIESILAHESLNSKPKKKLEEELREMEKFSALTVDETRDMGDNIASKKWLQPTDGGNLISRKDMQAKKLDNLLDARRQLPTSLAEDYVRFNHVVWRGEQLWEKEVLDNAGSLISGNVDGLSAAEIVSRASDEIMTEMGGEGLDVSLVKRESIRNLTPEERKEKEDLDVEFDSRLKNRFAAVSRNVEAGLSPLAEEYQHEMMLEKDAISPAGRISSRREMLRRLMSMSEDDAKLYDSFDGTDHLESLGVDVENMPDFATKGRLGLMKWGEQMSMSLHDFGNARDLMTAHWEYVGKEGELQQKALMPLQTAQIRADRPEDLISFGAEHAHIKDAADLLFQLQEMIRTGLKREDIEKYAGEVAEHHVMAQQLTAFQNSSDQSRITASRARFGSSVMFPIERSVRFMLSRNGKDLPETFEGSRGKGRTKKTVKMAEVGMPGDKRKELNLNIKSNNRGVGAHQVVRKVVEEKGMGVVYFSDESLGMAVVMSRAFEPVMKIWGGTDDSGAVVLESYPADILGVYGHMSPRLSTDHHGEKMNKARHDFTRILLNKIGDGGGVMMPDQRSVLSSIPKSDSH